LGCFPLASQKQLILIKKSADSDQKITPLGLFSPCFSKTADSDQKIS
jgi:hypothetical protein